MYHLCDVKFAETFDNFSVAVNMSESDISNSVKNGILFLEDPFDQVCATWHLFTICYSKALL